ncbi:MAG: hypothetical protein AAF756_20595 [Pseudomonadota bacterium]
MNKIGTAVVRSLGLEGKRVTKLVITCEYGAPDTVEATMEALPEHWSDEVEKVVETYELVERQEDGQQPTEV